MTDKEKLLMPFCIILLCIFAGCGSSETVLEDIEISKTDTIIKNKIESDTIYKDSSIIDTIYKDTVIHDTLIRDTIIKDTIIRDTIINDTTIVDTFIIKQNYYQNPIIHHSLADPSVIRGKDGLFYLYSTGRFVSIYKSQNLIDWTFAETVFDDETRPNINSGDVWAPDINYINGKYVLYYSQSVWGDEWGCGIGVAIADNPTGPFKNLGKLFTSLEMKARNSIDPFYIEDDGKKYLFWGSLRGIWGIELAEDGLSIKKGAVKTQIAGGGMEGTYIHKRNGYYYLFGSCGTCCNGLGSSYHITYGRATNLFGPYTTKDGKRTLDSQYEPFLYGSSFVAGPGHNAEFITDDKRQDWIIFHGYLRSDPDAGRIIFLNPVNWDGDWPYIENEKVVEKALKPVFVD